MFRFVERERWLCHTQLLLHSFNTKFRFVSFASVFSLVFFSLHITSIAFPLRCISLLYSLCSCVSVDKECRIHFLNASLFSTLLDSIACLALIVLLQLFVFALLFAVINAFSMFLFNARIIGTNQTLYVISMFRCLIIAMYIGIAGGNVKQTHIHWTYWLVLFSIQFNEFSTLTFALETNAASPLFINCKVADWYKKATNFNNRVIHRGFWNTFEHLEKWFWTKWFEILLPSPKILPLLRLCSRNEQLWRKLAKIASFSKGLNYRYFQCLHEMYKWSSIAINLTCEWNCSGF